MHVHACMYVAQYICARTHVPPARTHITHTHEHKRVDIKWNDRWLEGWNCAGEEMKCARAPVGMHARTHKNSKERATPRATDGYLL